MAIGKYSIPILHYPKVEGHHTVFTELIHGHATDIELSGRVTKPSIKMAAKPLVLKVIHLYMKFLVSGRGNISIT